jgi:hypothetical protein
MRGNGRTATSRLSQDKVRRQKLYKQFIDEASKLYADALVHDQGRLGGAIQSDAE